CSRLLASLYSLSLHDALPIFSSGSCSAVFASGVWSGYSPVSLSIYVPPVSNSTALTAVVPISRPIICLFIEQPPFAVIISFIIRSEEHTSELQSRFDLVCRLL